MGGPSASPGGLWSGWEDPTEERSGARGKPHGEMGMGCRAKPAWHPHIHQKPHSAPQTPALPAIRDTAERNLPQNQLLWGHWVAVPRPGDTPVPPTPSTPHSARRAPPHHDPRPDPAPPAGQPCPPPPAGANPGLFWPPQDVAFSPWLRRSHGNRRARHRQLGNHGNEKSPIPLSADIVCLPTITQGPPKPPSDTPGW